MTENINELRREIEKTLEVKLKKGTRKLFFMGLFLGLGIALTSAVVAVSKIGNHDHYPSQLVGEERLKMDTTQLNALACRRSVEKSTDNDSSINGAANCWEISTRTSAPTNFVGDVTYIDLRTGFMWSSMFSDTDGINLADSITNCDGASIRGFTDWRLPTISELREAFYHGYYEVAAGTDEDGDGSLTDNWSTDGDTTLSDEALWTSTASNVSVTSSFLLNTLQTWGVTTDTDTATTGSAGSILYSARCVRTAR